MSHARAPGCARPSARACATGLSCAQPALAGLEWLGVCGACWRVAAPPSSAQGGGSAREVPQWVVRPVYGFSRWQQRSPYRPVCWPGPSPASSRRGRRPRRRSADKAVLFAADGMRQDIMARYAAQGFMPRFAELLKKGVVGARRRHADPGAAEHRCRLVQPGDRRLAGRHGSTNNTFHINGQPFANRTAAFDPGVLQAETIAQAAERGGKKVAQIEWAGGRNGRSTARRSTSGTFFSGRGVATNYISADDPADDAALIASFGLQFDHPAGFAGQAAFPGAAPSPGDGLDECARVVQPGDGNAPAGARLRHRQVRPERLHLRLDERRHDELRPGAVLAAPRTAPSGRHAAQGPVGRRQGQDRRRRAGRPDGRHAGQGRGARRRTCPRCACSTPR